MRLNRWAMVHGRPDKPGYRYVCSLHWTRSGAQYAADAALRSSMLAGYSHTYWAEKRMGDDKPGDFYLVAPGVPSG